MSLLHVRPFSLSFLGTSSGGGPMKFRNCSSLVLEVKGDGSLYMVDCAEGTLRQFALQPYSPNFLRPENVKKIFVTHMHADHIMGIITFLRNLLLPPEYVKEPELKIELYGPPGLRAFVRTVMKATMTNSRDKYTVHELLSTRETNQVILSDPDPHESEIPGRDIICDMDGLWRNITETDDDVKIDAGLLIHRAPSLGYVFRETVAPSRKIVILGDTSDSSALVPLTNPIGSTSLLIHEATDAYFSLNIDPILAERRPETLVQEKVLGRGHSTPIMAGEFANKIGAHRLILNHLSPRFHTNPYNQNAPTRLLDEVQRQASESWGLGEAELAQDFMRISVLGNDDPHESQLSALGIPGPSLGQRGFRGGYRGRGGPRNRPPRSGGRGRGKRGGFKHRDSVDTEYHNPDN